MGAPFGKATFTEEYQKRINELGSVTILDGKGNILNEAREVIAEQIRISLIRKSKSFLQYL